VKRKHDLVILLALLLVAALGTLTMGGQGLAASSSPLQSPLPLGLENCPRGCIELLDCVGHPTCHASCVEDIELDPQFISPAVDRYGVCTGPAATPIPPCCEGWWRIEDWMGQYKLWTDGSYYYVEVEP